MLIKEYRIPLPLTVEEYRVAQLYMIAKKSREESRGAGSGVEILVNEPYTDGPGGAGQYTHKIYHVGNHLPGWFKALLPKSALTVEEKAWNAYPYTKTRYTCPFVEKFFLEIETKYFNDAGQQENVFNLPSAEARSRIVDLIDVAKDQLYGSDYKKEEDPKYYISQKTGRGLLSETWLEDYWAECQDQEMPLENGKAVMCAYKLCRVEFRYWGMQSKIEKFIHDVALRKTMLRAHRQAWVWQDEWVELTMEDIRELERETQEALAKKMAGEKNAASQEDSLSISGDGSALHTSPSGLSGHQVDLSAIEEDKDVHVSIDLRAELPSRSRSPSPNRPLVPKPCDLPLSQPAVGLVEQSNIMEKPYIEISGDGRRKLWSRSSSKSALHSPGSSSTKSFDLQIANWRMESIVQDSGSSSEEEYFDAEDDDNSSALTKWSSMEVLMNDDEREQSLPDSADLPDADSIFSSSYIKRIHSEHSHQRPLMSGIIGGDSLDVSLPGSPLASPAHQPCSTSILILVLHAGNVLDSGMDPATSKKSDVNTFRGAFETVAKQHYPSLSGHVAIRLISCPAISSEALAVLSSLSPYSFQASPSAIDGIYHSYDSIPLGALPLFGISTAEYQEHVSRVIVGTNQAYHDFLRTEDGAGFSGQVVIIGDSIGAVLGYDALCRTAQFNSHYGSETSIPELEALQHQYSQPHSAPVQLPSSPTIPSRANPLISISDGSGNEEGEDNAHEPSAKPTGNTHTSSTANVRVYRKSHSHPQESESSFYDALSYMRLLSAPPPRRRSSCSSDQSNHHKFDFDVSDFFVFGSPLGLVMAYRKMLSFDDKNTPPPRPSCNQLYNLFHPSDPSASRIEPLLSARFSQLPPVTVPRYQKYPLGDGHPIHLLEYLQTHGHLFLDSTAQGSYNAMGRRTSEASIASTMSGVSETMPLATITALTQKWWGTKRLDFALYCPEGLVNFPANALPHLFHASYWESSDVIAFLLRQLVRTESLALQGDGEKEAPSFTPSQPREKWLKKRTSVKLKNVAANHRANDVIVKEGAPQVVSARFMYGPLDMVALTGEKVDIHVMKDSRAGEWTLMGTEVTDKNGRITYTIPKEKALAYGMFPVKMVVRGDHTSIDFFLAVVPPKTETVVFSIDGSFTASVSVTGRDPKVRAGAVDVVRHWQELGYLIIYITGRPDMQQQRVVSWLSQHNFPHGLVSFADGLSTDPLRHKAEYLRNLQCSAEIQFHIAYGSSKDIWVYSHLGLRPDQIFIVGKVSKKQHSQATVLSDGYAAHLSDLKAYGGSRPAQGNARMVLPRGCFGLPGQVGGGIRQRRSAKRTTSYPLSGQSSERRGISPRTGLGKV